MIIDSEEMIVDGVMGRLFLPKDDGKVTEDEELYGKWSSRFRKKSLWRNNIMSI